MRTREFFFVERQGAVFFIDGHKALVEMPALDRGIGALLADQRQFIDGLTRNTFQRRDRIGANALMLLRMTRAQTQIAGIHERRRFRIGGRRRVAHHLRAAGDDEVFHTRHNVCRGDVHRRDA